MHADVTFETKCWENDWRHILHPSRLELLARRNTFPFRERVLMVNNVKRLSLVCRHAERATATGAFSKYVVVEEHAREALDYFGLSRAELGIGYKYSIAELVSIFLCRSEYLCHFAGDCIPTGPEDWIAPSLELMSRDARIKVCNPAWDYDEAKSEAAEENDLFYIGYGFSDQCYLVRTTDFQDRIYGETHPNSKRYPEYGGELFEKRVDSWMQNHRYLRATSKHASFLHRNWSKAPPSKMERLKHRMVRLSFSLQNLLRHEVQ